MARRARIALSSVLVLAALACSREATPASVLLLSADSLRIDQLAIWDPRGVETPRLAALAESGTIYRNAWATAPWTAPAMVSVMTGLYPPSHGIAFRDDTTPPGLPTLPRLLGERGYRLGNFSFFSQISYFENLGLGPPVPGLRHATVAESFGSWLAEDREAPFFAWLHLLETHLPYGATGYRARAVSIPGSSGLEATQLASTVPVGTAEFTEGDAERLRLLYRRDVEALDRSIGIVLDALEGQNRRRNTLIVFVADHGEELLDDGWVGHASTAVVAKLRPEILHVPLILAGPGVPAGRVRREMVQQVDVLPTLLALLGWPRPAFLDGTPLPGLGSPWRPPAPRRVAFFDSSPGGNLTPAEQRGVRIQGVTDGTCLLSDGLDGQRTLPLRPGVRCRSAPLLAALEHRRRQQGRQRLAILASSGGRETPPEPSTIDGYAEAIRFAPPARLTHQETGGLLSLAWQGTGDRYWLEYRLGDSGTVRGLFPLDQSSVIYGPVPEGFWNDLAGYSPFRLRIADPERHERSPWAEVVLVPTR